MYDIIIFTENTDPMQIAMPLGGFKIASVLRKNGYKTLVVNHLSTFNMDELKRLLDNVISNSTKIIGFSTTFFKNVVEENNKKQYLNMGMDFVFPQGKDFENEIVEYVKNKNNNVKFIAGGSKTIPMYSNKNINYVFMGYSETSIIHLLSHLNYGTKIPNSHKNIFGIVIIDDRTAPNYDFVGDSMIWEKSDILNHKVLPLEIGRGCIFKCKFCSYPLNGKKSLDYIKKSEIIYEELLNNFTNFGITHYFIVDDTFNDSVEKLEVIEKVIKKLPFTPIFWCYARLDLLCTRPETVDILYKIGIRAFYFGIETLDLKAGRIIGKGYDRQKQIEMINHIRTSYPDVSMHGSFIAGCPEETSDSIKQTMSQLLSGHIPLHSWMMKPLYIFSDTTQSFSSEIDLNYDKFGYVSQKNENGFIHWKNEHTHFTLEFARTKDFINKSRKQDFFMVPGHDSFEFVNFGYDFHESMKTPLKKFNFNAIKDDVDKFTSTYKKELFNYLKINQV